MRYFLLLIAIILFVACEDNSPEALTFRDRKNTECIKACEPRKSEPYSTWSGCTCIIDRDHGQQ